MTGLGAATADAIYGSIAGFGLTFFSNLLLNQLIWLRWVGGIFLIYIGIRIYGRKTEIVSPSVSSLALAKIYSSTFFLTLTNPTTILSFVAIYLGLGVVNPSSNYFSALLIVTGVFSGSLFWWFVLSGGIAWVRHQISANTKRWINRIAGIIIILFGLIAIIGISS
jgi:threonine/homoserine/homoserine lactone efflux protein